MGPGKINMGANGRRSGGFSLRKSLENQGVTTEEAMREHIATINRALSLRPSIDISRYRVVKK